MPSVTPRPCAWPSACIEPIPKTGERRSLAKIAAELAKAGYVNTAKYRGESAPRPFNPATIKAMVEGPMPEKRAEDQKMRTIRTALIRWLGLGVAENRTPV